MPKSIVAYLKKQAGLGDGMGVGGPRQGIGGPDVCRCPECGTEVEHARGVPCRSTECPECGTPMVGAMMKTAAEGSPKVDALSEKATQYGTKLREALLKSGATKDDARKVLGGFNRGFAPIWRKVK